MIIVMKATARARDVAAVAERMRGLGFAPEVGEVFECQVDRTDHRAGAAQVAKLVGLSLSEGHFTTIHRRADASLHSD